MSLLTCIDATTGQPVTFDPAGNSGAGFRFEEVQFTFPGVGGEDPWVAHHTYVSDDLVITPNSGETIVGVYFAGAVDLNLTLAGISVQADQPDPGQATLQASIANVTDDDVVTGIPAITDAVVVLALPANPEPVEGHRFIASGETLVNDNGTQTVGPFTLLAGEVPSVSVFPIDALENETYASANATTDYGAFCFKGATGDVSVFLQNRTANIRTLRWVLEGITPPA